MRRSDHFNRIRSIAAWTVPIVLFLIGTWYFPLALFGPENSLIPGDLGDARFNNYILEHFHLYTSGKVSSYWDAPFMYPWPNVIAHSDNLLGTAPIYSFIRSIGFNRETAFQGWILVMFSLNFWCCFVALRAWSGRMIISACGAFIFAFGIYSIGQMDHAQVYPRFMVPVAFFFTWRFLSSGHSTAFLLAALAIVYQFYCGIYLGFMLMYSLFFLVVAYLIVHWDRRSFGWIGERRNLIAMGGTLLLGTVLLLPLMLPYLEVSRALGVRQFHEVIASIPRPVSYFFTHPGAISWRDLSRHSQFAFPEWWSHFLFVGGMLWLAIITSLVLLFTKAIRTDRRKDLLVLGLALLLSTVFCMNFQDFIPYKLFFRLPGFSALRAMDRIINVQIMFFILLFVSIASAIPSRSRTARVLALMLPILVIIDNRVDVKELKRFDKWNARNMVDEVERHITAQWNDDHKAIAYTPLLSVIEPDHVHDRTIEINLTAMLAAQQVGLPIVNAYTGSYPPGFMGFFDHMDDHHLRQWCDHVKMDHTEIQQINDLQIPFRSTEIASVQLGNGKFICANIKKEDLAIADRDNPLLWETYRVIHFNDDRIAFRAHNEKFLSLDPEQRSVLRASAPVLGDAAIFTAEPAAEQGWFNLKTWKGEYLMLDPIDHTLSPNEGPPGPDDRFRLQPITSGSKDRSAN